MNIAKKMIEPYYNEDGITIYNADCRDVLGQLEPIDLIVTSPPYNCRKSYAGFDDQMAWSDYYRFMGEVLDGCYSVLREGGTLAVNVPGVVRWQADHRFADTWTGFDPLYKTHRNGESVTGKGRIEPVGFRLFDMMQQRDSHIREPIVWVKGSEGNAITSDYRMGCDSDPYLRPAHEMILLGSKGRWFHRGGTGRRGGDAVPFLDETKDVWFMSPVSDRDHPAIFPDALPSRLIKLFVHAKDAVILDPFFGKGTTLRVAKGLGVKAIGCDVSRRYCDMAVEWLKQRAFDFTENYGNHHD